MRAALLVLAGAAALRAARAPAVRRPRVLHTVAWWTQAVQNAVNASNGTANASNASNASGANGTAAAGAAAAAPADGAAVAAGPAPSNVTNATNATNATNGTNVTNYTNYSTWNVTLPPYPSPDPPVIAPTMLPPPQPVLSWPIGVNPNTSLQREAMAYTLQAGANTNYIYNYTRVMNERLVNASIETETILTGRYWGTPQPTAPHRPRPHELLGPVKHTVPAALRRELGRSIAGLNASAIAASAAANATATLEARLGPLDAGLAPLLNLTGNVSNCTPNASNGSNVTYTTAEPEVWPKIAEWTPPNATVGSTTPGPAGATTPAPFGATAGPVTTASPGTAMPVLSQTAAVVRSLLRR